MSRQEAVARSLAATGTFPLPGRVRRATHLRGCLPGRCVYGCPVAGPPARRLPGGLPSRGLRRRGAATKLQQEGTCRLCGQARRLTRHHLVPVVWFRLRQENKALWLCRNATANIIPLDRDCHDRVEESEVARRELRALLAQDEVAFAIQTIGRAWLDNTYPAG